MPKFLHTPWVKNVNKQRKIAGKKSVCLFTGFQGVRRVAIKTNVQLAFNQLFSRRLTMFISTTNQTPTPLLFGGYTHYPHPLLLKTLKKN